MQVKQRAPLELRNIIISPEKKLLGLSICLKRDRPGLFRDISSIVYKYGINFNYIYGFIETEGKVRVTTVLDLTNKDVDPRRIVEEIEGLDVIECVDTFEPSTDGLIADTTSFPLTVFGERVLMLRKSLFKEMILGLMKGIGPQLTAQLLYQMGVNMGRRGAKRHKEIAERLGLKDPMEILRKVSAVIFQSLGYSIVEEIEEKGDLVILKIKDCIELLALKDILNEGLGDLVKKYNPKCNMVRGMIEGAISEILGRDYRSREENCSLEGITYGEIVLKPIQGAI